MAKVAWIQLTTTENRNSDLRITRVFKEAAAKAASADAHLVTCLFSVGARLQWNAHCTRIITYPERCPFPLITLLYDPGSFPLRQIGSQIPQPHSHTSYDNEEPPWATRFGQPVPSSTLGFAFQCRNLHALSTIFICIRRQFSSPQTADIRARLSSTANVLRHSWNWVANWLLSLNESLCFSFFCSKGGIECWARKERECVEISRFSSDFHS